MGYYTVSDEQEVVEIEVFQGENAIAEENVPLGDFRVENLPPKPAGGIQVEVHFDFDINGILTVTTTEKGKGQQGTLVVNNAGIEKLSSHELKQARADLDALFEVDETIGMSAKETVSAVEITPELAALLDRAQQTLPTLDSEQAEELQDLLAQIEDASANKSTELSQLQEELSDFLYYAISNQSNSEGTGNGELSNRKNSCLKT